jgi:peptide/nickel transport system substrate-binding protein
MRRILARLALLTATVVLALPVRALEEPSLRGGKLVVAARAEPKTLNPLFALDMPSREVIGRMMDDLITIDRYTQMTKPALAESWTVSKDHLHYTLHLRKGLRFSDGHPFDADDVVFTFQVYLDEQVHSPQRDMLMVNGAPVSCRKLDALTVRIDLPVPLAAAERIFDSVWMLPRHILSQPYQEHRLAKAWPVNSDPASVAGLGPFRLKEYRPGERIVLERNPYYWKAPLPYLDQLEFLFAGNEDSQVARFLAGDADLVNRLGAKNAELVKSRGMRVYDVGPSLEYNFLVFNLNGGQESAPQSWFQQSAFRQAVSSVIDREGIVRLVYSGQAAALWGHVSPGNRQWRNANLPRPPRSIERARELLKLAKFHWDSQGGLLDAAGQAVKFTVITASSNQERTQMATIIQEDLKQIGIQVQVTPLEFRSMIDRVLNTHKYDAAVMALGGGDADPNPEMSVWLSSGSMHLWHPGQSQPATPWEAELDRLMRAQAAELNPARRKRLYDRVQEIEQEQLPFICLASPHVLVAARDRVRNLRPAVLDHYSLWNADEIYLADAARERDRSR